MNIKKNDVKLYNVLFPFWMILMFPALWFIVLPGNFMIDSLVFIVSMTVLKISNKKQQPVYRLLFFYVTQTGNYTRCCRSPFGKEALRAFPAR